MKADNYDERIAKMTFASVFPFYVEKVEKKGRTVNELYQVIEWLTGYDQEKVNALMEEKVTFEEFFRNASLNPLQWHINRCSEYPLLKSWS